MAHLSHIEQLAHKIESLGLTEKQAKVYIANLWLGSAPVQKIAEQAGINRPTAYVILNELEKMGLVSESTEGKHTVYVAEEAQALERLFELQERIIYEKRSELKHIMPALEAIERGSGKNTKAPVVRFYKGKEGIEAVIAYFFRKAPSRSQIYAMSNYDEVLRIFPNQLQKSVVARGKKNLSSKLLYFYKKEISSDKQLRRETKKLSNPVLADIVLGAQNATFIAYTDDPRKLTGILIESPEIVGALRQLFEMAWENTSENKK